MTAEYPQNPTATDFLQGNRFSFVLTKIPETVYHCQKVTLPGVSLPAIPVANIFSDMNFASNKLVFQSLSMTFKISENLVNWIEIYNWMAALGQPRKHGALAQLQRKNDEGTGEYSDLIINILTPKANPGIRVKAYRCFPVSLTPIQLDTDITDVNFLSATVEFAYTTLEFESLP